MFEVMKKDSCDKMSSFEGPCMECELIKKADIEETNKMRQLLADMKKDKEKQFRKLVGGTI